MTIQQKTELKSLQKLRRSTRIFRNIVACNVTKYTYNHVSNCTYWDIVTMTDHIISLLSLYKQEND